MTMEQELKQQQLSHPATPRKEPGQSSLLQIRHFVPEHRHQEASTQKCCCRRQRERIHRMEHKGASHSSDAIIKRLNTKLIQLSSGLAAASGPPAVPGFSSQGGFYSQFNDLSNGQYSLNELAELADQLIKGGNISGDFSTLCTQFNPSSPAVGLSINREVMGALNVDYQEAMDSIASLTGGNYNGAHLRERSGAQHLHSRHTGSTPEHRRRAQLLSTRSRRQAGAGIAVR